MYYLGVVSTHFKNLSSVAYPDFWVRGGELEMKKLLQRLGVRGAEPSPPPRRWRDFENLREISSKNL